ncbi:MAG: ScyD/ScyE family protein [Chloroflexi bacterium]|nr:ScyD/ScyE family protein [Chloroflexota bacterium]
MFRKGIAATLISLSLVPVLVLPALAQDATPEATGDMMMSNAIVSGLNNPRGISYDADGNLLIAEAGAGGSEVLMSTPDGDIKAGFSSQVNRIDANGAQSVFLPGLFSVATPSGEVTGLAAAYVQGSSLWLAVSGGGPAPNPQPFYGDGVIEVNWENGRIVNFIDTYAYELANNPDEADVVDSNVNNLTWGPDGTLYIVDTGANDILSWTAEDGLSTFMVWKDDPVPTAIRFADDGSFYVGFLGQGIAPMAAKVEHWSADGQTLIETFGNLTAVTDIAIGQDGSIYAVELLTQFGAQGPVPNTGAVVKVSADGTTPVAENLPQPYSLAQAPDGSWAVSIGSTFGPPGTGAVIKIG